MQLHCAESTTRRCELRPYDEFPSVALGRPAHMDGACKGSIYISQHKAMTSANFPLPTRTFGELAFGKEGKPSMVPGIADVPGIITFAGGLPIMTANKVQIGGIGVSGGTSDQDEDCAKAGLDALAAELK